MTTTTYTSRFEISSAARNASWGELDSYYPEAEQTDARKDQWEADEKAWTSAHAVAIAAAEAGDIDALESALDRMSSIEGPWGDTATTRIVVDGISQ